MGNNISSYKEYDDNNSFKSKLLNKFSINKNDEFIIKYSKQNDNLIDIDSLDSRRLVFVSLIGLYNTWKKVPSISLYTALFVMPLKSKWIYNPSKYSNELQQSFISKISAFSDIAETKQFIQLLKWKHSQGLVFWMLDEYKTRSDPKSAVNTDLVSPFWHHFNSKLITLYDPMTKNKYQPLHLDETWWKNNSTTFNSKFGANLVSILCELYFLSMKYKSIQEIIYESNPDSLRPVVSYEHDPKNKEKMFYPLKMDDNENWFISQDYDL